jgi:hypothetical protein
MTSHRLAGLAALCMLAAPAAASAAPEVQNAKAAPASTAAGAHSDFTVSFDVAGLGAVGGGGDDLKFLQLDLPPGLVGNPTAPGATCSAEQLAADACPAGTKVGTTVTTASVLLEGAPMDIAGDIYNVAPQAGEAARLGIVLRPLGGLLPKVVLQSPVKVRAADGGLTSTVDEIPATANGIDLRIDRMSLTLLGKLASGKAFMSNPTSCKAAPTTITVRTSGGQTAAASADFTPTACDALPFAPQISAKVGPTRDDVRRNRSPQIVVTVTQADGEANAKTVAVKLPAGLGASLPALAAACPVEVYAAGNCPASSVVGSGVAESPLLATPLTGAVTFVSDPTQGLPTLRIALRGAFDVNLIGKVSTEGGLTNTIDGIYDVPLSRFTLTIDAGATNPLSVARDLCLPGAAGLQGVFTAHSGKVATADAVAEVPGCDAIRGTTLRARFGPVAKGRPALHVIAANADRPVKALSFALPKGLRFTKKAKRLIDVTASDTRGETAATIRGRTVSVEVAGDGTPKLDVLVARGALRAAKSLRRPKAKRPKLALRYTLLATAERRETVRVALVRSP